jgi:hypothetical protein
LFRQIERGKGNDTIYEFASQLAFFFLLDKVLPCAMKLWQEREEDGSEQR